MSENDYKNEPWYSHLLLCAKFANEKQIRDACDGAVTELAEHEKLELALVGKLGRRDRTIIRLQAVVEKLDKTADGVPVIPGPNGTELFYHSVIFPGTVKGGAFWDGMNVRCKLITTTSSAKIGDKEYWGEKTTFGTMPDLKVSDCYSTYEAAEAAREQQ